MTLPSINYLALAPFLVMSGTALVLLIATSLTPTRIPRRVASTVAVSAAGASLLLTVIQGWQIARHGAQLTAAHSVVMDGFSALATASISSSLIFALLIAHDWEGRERFVGAEYQMLALLATSGAVLMTEGRVIDSLRSA